MFLVGIDIPNVNLLVVEDADRFGLSQLHQLRGRIGRAGSLSGLKCHCLLLTTAANGSHGDDSTSLTRLEVLRETMSGNEIANADFMLRGPGEFLGFLQSGIKTGFTVNPDNHWDMLESASVLGRGFFTTDGTISRTSSGTNESPSTANDLLLHNLRQEKIMVHYDQTHASLPRGFALRVIMALFAHWRHGPANDNNALDAFVDLHQLSASKNEEDNLVNDKILSLLQSFCDGSNIGYEILPRDDALSHSNNNVMVDSVLPVKPHVAVLSSNVSSSAFNLGYSLKIHHSQNALVQTTIQRPVKNRVNLMEEDVVFIVLDVETTGLDERTSHVIQLAAKVLGSNNEEDLFSGKIRCAGRS